MFYSKKIRTARGLRQHLVNRKAPEPCDKGFWNSTFSTDSDKNFGLLLSEQHKKQGTVYCTGKYCITFIPPTFYYAKNESKRK